MYYVDLRQDMLTLQIMTIMDNLWKELGLDLRYICMYVLTYVEYVYKYYMCGMYMYVQHT